MRTKRRELQRNKLNILEEVGAGRKREKEREREKGKAKIGVQALTNPNSSGLFCPTFQGQPTLLWPGPFS